MKSTTRFIGEVLDLISDYAEQIQLLTGAGKYEAIFEEDADRKARRENIMDDIYSDAVAIQSMARTLQRKILNYEVREDVANEYGWRLDEKGKVKWNG